MDKIKVINSFVFTIVVSIIITSSFVGCSNNTNLKQTHITSRLDVDSVHFLTTNLKNGLIECLFNDTTFHIGNSYSIFNKKGQLLSSECKTKFGEVIINEFQEGEIYRSSKYVWDSRLNDYRPQELRLYRNGIIDENEGDFIDIVILNQKNDNIEILINFVSAFNFVKGEILYGREINDYSDDKNLKSMFFHESTSKFKIKKSEIVFGTDSTFYCLVKVTTDSSKTSKYIQRNYYGDTWVSNYLVRKSGKVSK